jgi:hypothetical protein
MDDLDHTTPTLVNSTPPTSTDYYSAAGVGRSMILPLLSAQSDGETKIATERISKNDEAQRD